MKNIFNHKENPIVNCVASVILGVFAFAFGFGFFGIILIGSGILSAIPIIINRDLTSEEIKNGKNTDDLYVPTYTSQKKPPSYKQKNIVQPSSNIESDGQGLSFQGILRRAFVGW